jgi:protease-4
VYGDDAPAPALGPEASSFPLARGGNFLRAERASEGSDMKRHPVLFSIFLILLIVGVMSAAVIGFLHMSGDSAAAVFKDQVALINIRGVISEGKPITDLLVSYRENSNIKAIILNIDSPGGGVAPSQEVYTEVARTREEKPVVAFFGNVAASGGYYVAAGASKIVCSPGSLTGSIGALFQVSNVQELLNKVGLESYVIKAGKYKDIGSPYREMSIEEKALLEALLSDVHEQFIADIAKGRGMPADRVREVADGRIMTGQQAKDIGLVDEMGNFQDALRVAKTLAGIRGDVAVVQPAKRSRSFMDLFLDEFLNEAMQRLGVSGPRLLAVGG